MVMKYGTWGGVCNDNFKEHEANVFCKSQGFMGGYKTSEKFVQKLDFLIMNIYSML